MIKENILWSRAIEPLSGKLHREPTVLGVALIFIAALAVSVFFLIAVF